MESLPSNGFAEVPRLDVSETEVLVFRFSPCTDRQSTDRDERVLLKKSVIGNNTAKQKKRRFYYFLGRLSTSCMLSIDGGCRVREESLWSRRPYLSVCSLSVHGEILYTKKRLYHLNSGIPLVPMRRS